MPTLYPRMNLSPEATPWGRLVQQKLDELELAAERRAQGELNANKAQNGTLGVLGRNIVNLDAKVQTAFDSLTVDMGQVVSGNLDQSRVTGTWTKAVNTTGNVDMDGNINLGGDLYTPHGRATPVTTSYVSAYLNSDGRLGATASSVVYKRDFIPADTADVVKAILAVSLIRFHYIEAVERLGDDAPVELGGIAEYFASVGLSEYVFNNADGEPMGINYERLSIPLIAVVQQLHADGKARDIRMDKLEARLTAAGL